MLSNIALFILFCFVVICFFYFCAHKEAQVRPNLQLGRPTQHSPSRPSSARPICWSISSCQARELPACMASFAWHVHGPSCLDLSPAEPFPQVCFPLGSLFFLECMPRFRPLAVVSPTGPISVYTSLPFSFGHLSTSTRVRLRPSKLSRQLSSSMPSTRAQVTSQPRRLSSNLALPNLHHATISPFQHPQRQLACYMHGLAP